MPTIAGRCGGIRVALGYETVSFLLGEGGDVMPDEARRWWALIAVAASVLVVGLDLTVLNLALPVLARDLHASTGDLQWFASAYSLVLAAALLPAGLLGDRFGRKKVLLAGLTLFGASSAACAYVGSSGALIAARAFLGLGAAAILPLSLSILPVFFTEAERPRAIAVILAATFLGYPVGPLLGGWLLDSFWWGSVFLINVPVVVLALIAVAALMPESRARQRPTFDLPGVLLSSFGLTGLTYGFIRAGQDGWGSPAALAAIAAGAVLLAVLVAWERQVSRRGAGQPLVDLALFRSAGFTWGCILTTLVSFALFGILFAMPQYFQEVRGLNALGSGLRLLPMIGGLVAGMLAATRLQSTRQARDDVPGGSPALGAKSLVTSATWFALTGLGLGLALPTAMNAALSALSPERSGTGSALISAMRQVGATIGVAILGTVLSSAYRSQVDASGLPPAAASAVRNGIAGGIAVARQAASTALLDTVRTAFVHALDVMLGVCGGIALASALLALAFLPRPTPAAAPASGDTRVSSQITEQASGRENPGA
jgi:MFS family permease